MSEVVFLSGSRKISRLNQSVRTRIDKVLAKRMRVVVGDANGADKAVQAYLADRHYSLVTVFCADGRCRNNLGSWEERAVAVPLGLTGRDFYTQKDVAMAEEADYGLVLWDGKSVGSINNVLELMKRGRPVVVYHSPRQKFITVRSASDVTALLEECDPMDRQEIRRKTSFERKLREVESGQQTSMAL